MHLVIGGSRSGKTAHGLRLAENSALEKWLIATATASDPEMSDRIERHRQERGGSWFVIEEPYDLLQRLQECATAKRVIVVDCLTLWLSNLMFKNDDVSAAVDKLCLFLDETKHCIILITNEIGSGLVPEHGLGRAFRDAHGSMNQAIARSATTATFVVAGLPLVLKDHSKG